MYFALSYLVAILTSLFYAVSDISAVLAITGKKPEAWESTFARSVMPLLMNSLSYSKMILITLIISTVQTAGNLSSAKGNKKMLGLFASSL